jgi:ribosomal-protein-alanine N-acetyltransferase
MGTVVGLGGSGERALHAGGACADPHCRYHLSCDLAHWTATFQAESLLMVILNTERLVLRHLESGDLDSLYALYRDPEIRRYYPDGTRTLDETKAELDGFLHGHPRHQRLGLWATVERSTGEFLGRCGLLPWHIQGNDEVELAFMIKKQRWREGFATESARGIIQYAHEVLGLRRLVCLVMPGNAASAGVATKVGMSFECEFTDEFGHSHLYARALSAK